MILLDTHVLLWAVREPEKLSRSAASEIRRSRRHGGVAVSAMTVWELAVLFARGKVRALGSVEASVHLVLERVTVLPITPEIASLATQFPDDYPRDPSDRIIGATARAGGMTLVTRDERIRRSPLIRTVW